MGISNLSEDSIFAYVYGILHSSQFLDEFEVSLLKEAPRIPIVSNSDKFIAYAEAGQALLDLHLEYEAAEHYPTIIENWSKDITEERMLVTDKRISQPKITDPKTGKKVLDTSKLVYNEYLTLENIPEDAHHWRIGTRTAIEWIMDRYYITTHKNSGIVNDPNQWGLEQNPPNPRYIIDLIKSVVTVACETHRIIQELPKLSKTDLCG